MVYISQNAISFRFGMLQSTQYLVVWITPTCLAYSLGDHLVFSSAKQHVCWVWLDSFMHWQSSSSQWLYLHVWPSVDSVVVLCISHHTGSLIIEWVSLELFTYCLLKSSQSSMHESPHFPVVCKFHLWSHCLIFQGKSYGKLWFKGRIPPFVIGKQCFGHKQESSNSSLE